MREITDKYKIYFIYLGLAVSTFAIYWQVHAFEFINYDDYGYVSRNKHISSGLTRENIIWVFTHEHGSNWHPLTGLSHMLDCELFGLDAGAHHVVSLLFHIANTLLLFAVLRRMTGTIWQSAFAAGLFALHPLHTESVAWISERKDVLSTFFWVLTMAAYLHYVKNPKAGNYISTVALFILGLLSKPMLVTLPFVLLLLDYWPLNRLELKNGRQLYRLIKEKIPFFILSAISSIVTFLVQRSAGSVRKIETIPLAERAANAVISYVKYIGKLFVPARLAAFYPYAEKMPSAWQIFGAAAILAVITILVIRFAAKYKYLAVGWFWYVGTLVPVIGLVQVGEQAMADRYSYVPFIGLFITLAWGANDLLGKWRYKKTILSVLSMVIMIVLCVLTRIQAGYWQNSISLHEHTIKVTIANYKAHYGLGLALSEQNKLEEAVNQFRYAIGCNPNYADAWYELGNAYNKFVRIEDAIGAYEQAIKIVPGYAEAYYGLGIAYDKLGRYDEALQVLKEAIRTKPDYAEAYNNLGATYRELGKHEEAIQAYQQAIRIKPDYAMAYNNLGAAYLELGRYEEVIELSKQALAILPEEPMLYNNLGAALHKLGRYPEAIDSYRQAVRLKPDYASAHYNLGLSYLKSGDSSSAMEEYRILKTFDAEKADKLFDVIQKQAPSISR